MDDLFPKGVPGVNIMRELYTEHSAALLQYIIPLNGRAAK
jgi:hypothetical protein